MKSVIIGFIDFMIDGCELVFDSPSVVLSIAVFLFLPNACMPSRGSRLKTLLFIERVAGTLFLRGWQQSFSGAVRYYTVHLRYPGQSLQYRSQIRLRVVVALICDLCP